MLETKTYLDILMLGQRGFAVVTVDAQRHFDLLVEQHEYAYTLLRFAQQNLIEPPVVAIECGSLHIDFGTEPPVGNVNLLGGRLQSIGHGCHILCAVDIPNGLRVGTHRSIRHMRIGTGEITCIGVRCILQILHPFFALATCPTF